MAISTLIQLMDRYCQHDKAIRSRHCQTSGVLVSKFDQLTRSRKSIQGRARKVILRLELLQFYVELQRGVYDINQTEDSAMRKLEFSAVQCDPETFAPYVEILICEVPTGVKHSVELLQDSIVGGGAHVETIKNQIVSELVSKLSSFNVTREEIEGLFTLD